MPRMTIRLSEKAAERLSELARREYRDPREQASFMLEKSLAVVIPERQAETPGQAPEVKALVDALRSVEWVQGEDAHSADWDYCPWCETMKKDGHADNCQRQSLLAAFKVPE